MESPIFKILVPQNQKNTLPGTCDDHRKSYVNYFPPLPVKITKSTFVFESAKLPALMINENDKKELNSLFHLKFYIYTKKSTDNLKCKYK